MQIIGIDGIPFKLSIQETIRTLSKLIHVNFEGLNFGKSFKKGKKIFYINILDNVDSMKCIKEITSKTHAGLKLTAFIPDEVPYMNSKKNPKKAVVVVRESNGVKATQNKLLKMPKKSLSPDKMVTMTRNLIVYEMHDRYTGLAELNETTGRMLYLEMAKIIKERLQVLMNDNPESCFVLSGNYRWAYPHNTDFGTLLVPALQRTGSELQLTKEMLKPYPPPYETEMIDNVPVNQLQDICKKYSKAITEEIIKHIDGLETDVQGTTQNIDQAARHKVREHLKKLAPSVPAIVRESLLKHFKPANTNSLLRVYGVPCLPKIDILRTFFKKYQAQFFRSPYAYNCLHLQAPNEQVPALLAADDTVIDGRRLVVRIYTHDGYMKIVKEISVADGGQFLDSTMQENDVQLENEEAWENWDAGK